VTRLTANEDAALGICKNNLFFIQAQFGLAGILVRSMTLETVFREDRPDLAVKIDILFSRCKAGWREHQQQGGKERYSNRHGLSGKVGKR